MVKKSNNQQEQQVTEEATLHEEFSIAEAAAITGVASHHIQQWIDLGWVKPPSQQTLGEETRDLFNRIDIYAIAYLKKIKESGFSRKLAHEKINIYAVNETVKNFPHIKSIGIAFSRVLTEGQYETQGAWLIAPELDQETEWDSLALIGERLNQGADDFYILNFFKLKDRIDSLIDEMKG
jgi:DNA-binding transcriptional MerR regulator